MKTTTYAQFLSDLDFELKQEKESADSADAEKFRTLPRRQAPRYINDIMKKLVRLNPSAYSEEFEIQLFDSSDGEYYPPKLGDVIYVDMVSNVSGNILKMPDRIYELYSIMSPFLETGRLGEWFIPFDSTVSNSSLYCPSGDSFYNSNGWASGDAFRAKACLYPDEIRGSIANVTITSGVHGNPTVLTVAANTTVKRGMVVSISGATPIGYNVSNKTVLYADATKIVIDFDSSSLANLTVGTLSFAEGNQIIPIDDGYVRFLMLEVKKAAMARKDMPLNNLEYSELMEYRREWHSEKLAINVESKLKFRGNGFGGGR